MYSFGFAVCLCVVCCLLFNCAGDPFITRLIVFSMAFSGAVQNMQYSSVCRIWCKDSSTYTLLGIKYKFPWKGPVFVVFICLHKLEWSVLWNLGAGNWRKLEWNLHFFSEASISHSSESEPQTESFIWLNSGLHFHSPDRDTKDLPSEGKHILNASDLASLLTFIYSFYLLFSIKEEN